MFQLESAGVVDLDLMENPKLRSLLGLWTALQEKNALPRLGCLDPRQLGENLGRTHLIQVMAPGKFRFLMYGADVTNTGAKSMAGLTTDDYDDQGFAAMVKEHYQEIVTLRRPICREIKGTRKGAPYRYLRLGLPFSSEGQRVDFLLVGNHPVELPQELFETRQGDNKGYLAGLMADVTSNLDRLRRGFDKGQVQEMRHSGTALLWNIAAMKGRERG